MCLKAFCDEAIVKFPPLVDAQTEKIKYTYCNFGVDYIAQRMRYHGFSDSKGPMLADLICEILRMDWIPIKGEYAFDLAKKGTLCIAAMSSDEIREIGRLKKNEKLAQANHGHVAVVYPALDMGYSGSWGKKVPMLANVGRTNGVLCASQCFPAEPKYYLLPGGHSSQGEL